MKKITFAVLVAIGILTSACDEKKAAPTSAAPAEQKAAVAAPAKATTAADSLGIAECDEYFKQMEACLSKAQGEAKAGMEQAIKASREAWVLAAATPEGKEGLKVACKTATDSIASNPVCK